MTLTELIAELERINKAHPRDPELNHSEMDDALLDFINSESVREEFGKYAKWYA